MVNNFFRTVSKVSVQTGCELKTCFWPFTAMKDPAVKEPLNPAPTA